MFSYVVIKGEINYDGLNVLFNMIMVMSRLSHHKDIDKFNYVVK